MLQKGIIETIEDKYTVKVRVPKYDKVESSATGTRKEDLATGIVCTFPGMNVTYSVGDVVLVDFENDELSKPVILGLLYRNYDSKSVLELKGIDSSIDDINEKLTSLSNKSLYTHIKYSNDNGNTFTSLYDPGVTKENEDFTTSPIADIEISPNTKTVYWTIIDENNNDITSTINITTYVYGENEVKGININQAFTEGTFEMPLLLQACTDARINYTIQMPKADASKYYISLTTDLNDIGAVYGDYIGVSISNDVVASTNTKDYSWTSTKMRNDLYMNQLRDELLPRIQNNEIDIRGYSEDEKDNDSRNGLLEALLISLNAITVGLNRNTIFFGNGNQYIDVGDSSMHVSSVVQGEFEFKRVVKSSTPHLILSFIED